MSSIRHVWVPVSDLDRSIRFYTEKLGLQKKMAIRTGETNGGVTSKESFAKLETSDKNVLLYLIEKPKAFPAHGSFVIGFIVKSLKTVKSEFEKSGIKFIGDLIELDDRKVIHFVDPDGHIFQIGELT